MLSFAHRSAEELHQTGAAKGIPEAVARRAPVVFDLLDNAKSPADIRFLPSLRFRKVRGAFPARFMVHVHAGWWITFRWVKNACRDIRITRFHQ